MASVRESQPYEYLGTGWSFPVQQTLQGGIQLSAAGQSVNESILLILRTSLGERVYRPNFGSRLSELAFAPINAQTLLLLRLYVEEALQMWEPRIWLEEVVTEPTPAQGRVDVVIRYRLRETHDRRSLVFPFYLLPAEGTGEEDVSPMQTWTPDT